MTDIQYLYIRTLFCDCFLFLHLITLCLYIFCFLFVSYFRGFLVPLQHETNKEKRLWQETRKHQSSKSQSVLG